MRPLSSPTPSTQHPIKMMPYRLVQDIITHKWTSTCPRPNPSPPTSIAPLAVTIFAREIRRIYVQLPALEQKAQQNQPDPRSPYIIPQRIVCPKCSQVDRYCLAPQTLSIAHVFPCWLAPWWGSAPGGSRCR